MKKSINKELISALANILPPEANIANALSDILPLGKEAIYRRLRGHVQFTLEEAAVISKTLGISLDFIVGMKDMDRAVFGLRLLQSNNLTEKYCEVLDTYANLFKKMKSSKNSRVISACRYIPYTFSIPFPGISKFKLYRWLYQTQPIENIMPFSEFIIPQKVLDTQQRFISEIHFMPESYFIFDKNVFISFAREIEYFSKLNLITTEEINILKSELLQLLSTLELTAATGIYNSTNRISLYLSDIDFDASYSHFEGDVGLSVINLYSIGTIDSQNGYIHQCHKDWIESLKRFSTLITQSGGIPRQIFFNNQKQLINSIL
ncbi:MULTISPECIES: hypothetical protein [unclassified Dysgonomonas]|uniref:hypothetical protein n=1 Tax=unclassified Dysgonomonas TaxID=2630389 RepID=UPI0013ED46F3|nr:MULTISPECIES: hypothetical protein [unclassified Dysgonomonas]